jgi:Family of unknown function (DUF6510)
MTGKDPAFVLDGNAAADLLQEIFVADVTTAQFRCEACASTGVVGSLRLYAAPMGAALRCGNCDGILIRAVRTPHGRWLQMPAVLRFVDPASI